MDPFEEFEFKPLTDGLGFHKKRTTANEDAKAETFPKSKRMVKDQGLEMIDEASLPLTVPLPRKPPSSAPLPERGDSGATAVEEILRTLQKNRRFDFDNSKQKIYSTSAKEQYKKTTWSFSASILDTMLVVAASLLCMIILLVITKVDLIGNIANPDSQGMIYLSLASVLGGVAFIYLTLNRIYVGCTPGEWAFDQRMGKPEELNTPSFSLRVMARSLVIIATGLIVLPILSALTGKDLAGAITGAQLYKKV